MRQDHCAISAKSRAKRKSSLRAAVTFAAVAFVATTLTPNNSFADEGGVSFWLPGIYGSLAAAPQQPGWSFAAINYYTNVSASGAAAASREITVGRFNPTDMIFAFLY